MEIALCVLVGILYLIAGFFVARYFVNEILYDGKWSDTGTEPGAIMLLFMHALWLPLLLIALIVFCVAYLSEIGIGNFIKNLYKKRGYP